MYVINFEKEQGSFSWTVCKLLLIKAQNIFSHITEGAGDRNMPTNRALLCEEKQGM